MSAFFVTATGTDIGKTWATAALIRHLRARSLPVAAIKPVASGFSRETAEASDPGVLLAALGEPATEAKIAQMSPWLFRAPLSPDMAAAAEGRTIDYGALVDFCRARVADCPGVLFVEGVGGVMVPLDGTHTVRDWMADLALPLVVVAGSYLGTISHTLTALEAIRSAGLEVAALAVNETPGSTVPLRETCETLARFVGRVPIAPLARREGGDAGSTDDVAALWDILARHI